MSTTRRILAIETSGRAGSVCVADGERVLASVDLPAMTRHDSGLHAAIDRLVREQGWRPDALDEVYVSAGPGSFTGVRIGVTVARTLAWATQARLVRVPTVDALARNALTAESPPEHVAVVLDAKRKQIYSALFARSGATYTKLTPEAMVDPTAFLAEAHRTHGPIAVLGEGVAYHHAAIEQAGAAILPEALWPARAECVYAVGSAMATAGHYCEPGDCVPIYIRLPEPEEKWQARQAAAKKQT
ncbi:MAG: tRNA (adenosine(37)-N6)-threonylcarbamoyltransferase complex dimerization subunit type 1 TsaB [Phycisphaerae bacterium]|nr:tRNA (adenosine(37)-N6)-threonylcarbamoyltransferase complex dimerization subunit type 1 TsaB [Phycisphaerae bacterium]